MQRSISIIVSVAAIILAGVSAAAAPPPDHGTILNAVNSGTTGGSTAHSTLQGEHAAQDTAHTALSGKVDDVKATVDALAGGGGGGEGNHTLRWDQALPAAARFVVLADFGNAAVLDKETGLVWEKSPATTTHTWSVARFQCTARTVGGRKGWRLPSVHELASLVDPTNPTANPFLSAGHPFTDVQSDFYWSATTNAENSAQAWNVLFTNGLVGTILKTGTFHVWCVRGGMNADQY